MGKERVISEIKYKGCIEAYTKSMNIRMEGPFMNRLFNLPRNKFIQTAAANPDIAVKYRLFSIVAVIGEIAAISPISKIIIVQATIINVITIFTQFNLVDNVRYMNRKEKELKLLQKFCVADWNWST